MTSTFLTPSPLCAFETDSYYKIHIIHKLFHDFPHSIADVIYVWSPAPVPRGVSPTDATERARMPPKGGREELDLPRIRSSNTRHSQCRSPLLEGQGTREALPQQQFEFTAAVLHAVELSSTVCLANIRLRNDELYCIMLCQTKNVYVRHINLVPSRADM